MRETLGLTQAELQAASSLPPTVFTQDGLKTQMIHFPELLTYGFFFFLLFIRSKL